MRGPFKHRLFDNVRGRGDDIEFNPRVLGLVAADQFGDAKVLVRYQRIDDTQIERAAQIRMHTAYVTLEALDVRDQLQARGVYLATLLGQGKTTTTASAQAHGQPDFQSLDIAADRG
jgi:hypothetical protein